MITCILTKRILLVSHYGWQTPSRMNSFVLDRVHIYIDCDRFRLVRFSLKPFCVQIGSISNRLQSFPVITTVHTAHLIRSRIDSIFCCLPGTCHHQPTVAWIYSWLILSVVYAYLHFKCNDS